MAQTAKFVDFHAVKKAVSIVQILEHYKVANNCKRSGNGDSLIGPCPLHKGENPTHFRVSISKNCWHCFGKCGKGGNILDFVSRMEDCSIRRAALHISEWFDLSTTSAASAHRDTAAKSAPTERGKTERQKPSSGEHSDDGAPNKPLGFELQNLDQEHPYFDERGLIDTTVLEFGLGYCGKGSMAGRIVIPIHNVQGELVAYGGRWPGEPPADTPKYKLPAGFRKAVELFGLHRAIEEPDDEPLVVVEGFFDAIRLWQHGTRKVIALMGSSMSAVQEELILRHISPTAGIVLMLDEDDAGRAGRDHILLRLALHRFVRAYPFETEGFQPEHLAPEQLAELFA